MPVRKYRSVADMPRPPADAAVPLAQRIRVLWRRAFLLCPPDFVRGVSRFRTSEAANQARAQATAARMRRTATKR